VSKGVRTGIIRPAGRTDVTVNGMDFNTPDSLMFEYIQKFGGVLVNNSVIYSKFSEGPFKGKFTGERKYQVPNNAKKMGTYHYLDNARIKIFYRGNEKTCGRCHLPPRTCPGAGLAKDCHSKGGERVFLSDHMRKTWEEIGFKPATFTRPTNDDAGESDKPIAETNNFRRKDPTAAVNEADEERFVGLTIANINLEVSDEDIKKFVSENVSKDLDEKSIDIIRDKTKAVVTITSNLTAEVIKEALSRINFIESKKKFFDRPLYCRPLRDITPNKNPEIINNSTVQESKTPSTEVKTSSTSTPQAQQLNKSSLHTVKTSSTSTSPTLSTTGTIAKVIPGLNPEAQAKALSNKKKKERKKEKEKKKQEEIAEKTSQEKRIRKNLCAFDIMMKNTGARQEADTWDSQIPAHCSPQPWTSKFGQQISQESRRI
jgi:hypothetical protein